MAKTRFEILPGVPYPLGATFDGAGVNFALFSERATGVVLCLFDGDGGNDEVARIPFVERTEHIWHAYVRGIRPGRRYGYRVRGPYEPEAGNRFDFAKLLLDPYARAIDRVPQWHDSMLGSRISAGAVIPLPDSRNSTRAMPKCVVVDSAYDWTGDSKPATAWKDTVIYEAHVKGLTALHPEVPKKIRGTYAGLASEPVLKHLKSLGVTAIELMPVHQTAPEQRLHRARLTNYWGYSSIGYFAPDIRFASISRPGRQVIEFKDMVKGLHQAGFEVILVVVYNHTVEGDEAGPTICFRGLDNAAYYRHREGHSGALEDFTGCGNSLDLNHPRVLQLVLDSLRYWVNEMHVDGFRFDLASTLARGARGEFGASPFLAAVQQDPVLSQVKLIAEPWDLGAGGYRIGNFPVAWHEWNGKYRDTIRDFWRGAGDTMGEFASRLTGSSDLYQAAARAPAASINYVTAHDGFTLADLVSYNSKHNEANDEDNRDGDNHNRSWNCGVEGPISDPAVRAIRERQQRNFLTTLFLSQGVPMLLAGDEFGRSQRGNNNAYCQDNRISWVDWNSADPMLLEFSRALIKLRREHPVFRRRGWFTGLPPKRGRRKDLGWFRPDGAEMTADDWGAGYAKTLGMFLNGHAPAERRPGGAQPVDDSFFLIFNSYHEAMEFKLPARNWGRKWRPVLDTAASSQKPDSRAHAAGGMVHVAGRAMVVLKRLD